jgi:hypothetical protein
MWLRNVKPTTSGLVNGSVGTIKDFIYKEGEKAPALPLCIIADVATYCGPPFFREPERRTWVPLRPAEEGIVKGGSRSLRRAYPMCLSYGLTAHKAQGQTNKGYAVVHLGDSEKCDNGSYTMFTRTTRLDHLLIPGGASWERLTTKLQTKKMAARKIEEARLAKMDRETKQWIETVQGNARPL